jgi:hypothetical protein
MITTLEDVQAWLGPGYDTPTVTQAYNAAEAWVSKRVRYPVVNPLVEPPEPLEAPDDLKQAVRFQTARYLARRNSPDGMVGLGDLGVARIPVSDQDVQTLINPWRRVVT